MAMQLALFLITSALLLSITYMDFKKRYVLLPFFCGLFASTICYAVLQTNISTALLHLVLNSAVILLIAIILFMYYRFTEKTRSAFINSKIGSGDILFWFCITPLFSVQNFLLFFIFSLLLILCIVLIKIISSPQNKTTLIPLAGYQSLLLFLVLLINQIYYQHNLSVDILSLETLVNV